MPSINVVNKEIHCKIVYYGPALAGKTTNLAHIHNKVGKKQDSELVSMETQGDRTIFFDFLPLTGKEIKGFTTRFHCYTVPGQVMYNETRKMVLKGVDGLVFVADSQWERQDANEESLANLKDNLDDFDRSLEDIPYILQYNKRDLDDIADVKHMEYLLNGDPKDVPSFKSIATEGKGVIPTLNKISKKVVSAIMKELN